METKRINTPDGISWHVEIFKPDPPNLKNKNVILIPSGEGDYASQTAVATILSSSPHDYAVTTFDTPGMSRITAPKAAGTQITPRVLATQLLGLLDALRINTANPPGCSSGGAAALALAALHPDRVECATVNEVPMRRFTELESMLQMCDEEIIATCEFMFEAIMVNDNPAKWKALGPEYHERLKSNFVRFTREYTNAIEDGAAELFVECPENLRRRPVFWTVGGLREGVREGKGMWQANFVAAEAAGLTINVERLMCVHLPNGTVPEDCAGLILAPISRREVMRNREQWQRHR